MGIHAAASRSLVAGVLSIVGLCHSLAAAQSVRADAVAYLVNITVRQGYNFPDAQSALNYGYGICDHITQGARYELLITEIKSDFGFSDDYQASYLINQAANELCPALIWQLRQSAAGYTGTPPVM